MAYILAKVIVDKSDINPVQGLFQARPYNEWLAWKNQSYHCFRI